MRQCAKGDGLGTRASPRLPLRGNGLKMHHHVEILEFRRHGSLRMPGPIDPGAQIVPAVVPIGSVGVATTPVVGAINVGVRAMAAVVRGAGRGGAGARGGSGSVSARASRLRPRPRVWAVS